MRYETGWNDMERSSVRNGGKPDGARCSAVPFRFVPHGTERNGTGDADGMAGQWRRLLALFFFDVVLRSAGGNSVSLRPP